ncbi:hypothetical protein H4W31_005279 [Plantactinospora soyae]|uniref:Uncharacterized protein n=1 Tax=Plantactinospora soyae TaxID=1544732 RepID=A0A927MAK3_9ACTN|nr:hypothetical protein [Plantactinospora soyae]
MRLRIMVRTVAVLLAATGVATFLLLGQAQGTVNLAGFTWSN